jgi:hypothetical protein
MIHEAHHGDGTGQTVIVVVVVLMVACNVAQLDKAIPPLFVPIQIQSFAYLEGLIRQ